MKQRLCILCGGRSAEHEISLLSARNVVNAADPEEYEITVVGIAKDGTWYCYRPDAFLLHPDDAKRVVLADGGRLVAPACVNGKGCLVPMDGTEPIVIDVAFPVMHGTFGEDGSVQGLLRMLNVPIVGCDLASSANAMDKAIAKVLLREAGLNVAAGEVLTSPQELDSLKDRIHSLGWPVFVKPARLGSSVGVARVETFRELEIAVDDAFAYDTKVLIEECVAGREIECAVLGNECPTASVPGEVIPQDGFYSYKAKYIDEDGALLSAPADLPESIVQIIQEVACRAFGALGCTGMTRVDFFLKEDGSLVVNELNTIPGFTKISMYPKLWELTGIPCRELVRRLVALAVEHHAELQLLKTEMTL